MFGLFLLYVTTNVALLTTGIVWLSLRTGEKAFKKSLELVKKSIKYFSEKDLIPILKERNITRFEYEPDERVKLEVSYNGKTIFAVLKSAIFNKNLYEEIYAFEYDLEEERLLYTERENCSYQTRKSYDELNPYLKQLADRLIEIDWVQKSKEEILLGSDVTIAENKKEQIEQTEEMETIKAKAQSLLEHIDLLDEDEKKELHTIITEEIEKTFSFYRQTEKEEKIMYEPIILEKLKEIDGKLENITNRIEERKYKAFKEKLKIEYTEKD